MIPALTAASFDPPAHYGRSKRMSLHDAIAAYVRPRMALHVCWSDARPNAALLELVRQFRDRQPAFTLSCVGLANSQVAVAAAGIVRRIVTAYAGESYPAGAVNPLFKRLIDSGALEIENWTQATLVTRLMAGALGLPFMPTRSLRDSALAREHAGARFGHVMDPFGSAEAVGVVSALVPDLAFVQGIAADDSGNVLMAAPFGEAAWGAFAAKDGVIACVEQIVDAREIRACNQLVKIPGHVVRAVCHVPFGSHPYGSYAGAEDHPGNYVEDAAFIADTAQACRDPQAFAAWLERWVYGVADHDAYLAQLGAGRLATLRAAARQDHWRSEVPAIAQAASDAPATAEETMIVVAARRMASIVRANGYQVLLAGIGASNLAAWLAEAALTADAVPLALLSEIGIYGCTPRPGEPFVFSNRNLGTARALTDVTTTLGTLVAGRHNRCLGALGAALVDAEGNLGTTYDNDGGFIVGSGGANDIASAAREVIVTVRHGPRRLVQTVAHVTSPGHAVRTIVTTRGVLVRGDAGAPFVLASVMPRAGESAADAIRAAVAGCGWALRVADDVAVEPPPTDAELRRLRWFDPQRHFLGPIPTPTSAQEHTR
ncbi:MAG: glutaconate CoA-transferase [Proteobacteria bacterium]|nr:glutaconate CoA-transferase [Pseudomonadota bacterium]